MGDIFYDLPQHLLPMTGPGRWIVRVAEPASLAASLALESPERLVAVRLLSLSADSEPLNAWAPGLPIELVLTDSASEYPLLYRHTNLLDNHPVRAVIPVQPGFSKAVKVAVSLDFAVRLELGQPEAALIDELMEVLAFYLHQPTVAQPIECFHSTLLGFYHDQPVSLWAALEEEPTFLRYIADDGQVSLYGRLAHGDIATAALQNAELTTWIDQVLASASECRCCEFLESCGGYFKWPRPDYDCAGVKRLFGALRTAAVELRQDLTAVAD